MKRTLIAALAVLTLCLVVVGFYRGWFSLSSRSGDAGSNKVHMNLTVDPNKVKEDAGNVQDQAAELTGK